MRKMLTILVLAGLIFVQSCGTLFKQRVDAKPHSGKLDVTIVVLDSLLLLFFIIPGVVAFAVDYSNGTLYEK